MTLSRREFIRKARSVGLFYTSFAVAGCASAHSANLNFPLLKDKKKLLDLPEGFTYTLISETGGKMSDGFYRPGSPDGMACFAHPTSADKCILLRNHEIWPSTVMGSPFGKSNKLFKKLDRTKLYGKKKDGRPFFGGVTKVIYNLKTNQLEEDFLVLTGTAANCAGGETPWGSWLSCEEQMLTAAETDDKYHGFVFEVPASATGLVDPEPIIGMGRFAHEAAAVDPATGIVYLTEDNGKGLFYRYIPHVKGEMHKGGRLQALALKGWKSANTTNWPKDWGGSGFGRIKQGQTFDIEWIDMEDVESPNGDLAARGHAAGAAQFCRGEGMAYGVRPGTDTGEIFFNCTQGGAFRAGQVWKYAPGPDGADGKLTLVFESPGADTLDMNDNLAFAPWGDLILCEDGPGNQYLRGLTPEGKIYDLARNAHKDKAEFCGACFSPDGRTMFVNVQNPGMTYAIRGPWETLRV